VVAGGVDAELLSVVLELMTFCVERHSYHCKNYVMNKNVGGHVLVLLNSRHAFVSLGLSLSLSLFVSRSLTS